MDSDNMGFLLAIMWILLIVVWASFYLGSPDIHDAFLYYLTDGGIPLPIPEE